jgi:hypothetical protein
MISISDGAQNVSLDADEAALLDEISIEPTAKRVPLKPKPTRPSVFARKMPSSMQAAGPPPEEEGLDFFTNPTKRSAPPPPPVEEYDGAEEEEEDGPQYEEQQPGGGYQGGGSQMPSEGYKTIEDEKADLLNKITRLVKKGIHSSARLTIYSDIEEIRTEYKRMTYSIECERSIKFQRRMLIAAVTGLEFLNDKFDPFDLELNGWSQNCMENVEDYDGVFEDLYNKYKTKVNVAPEVKLIMMVGGSAMMFHLTNSMFKAAVPNMGQVMKQNPELMRNMMDAVQRTNGGAFEQGAGPAAGDRPDQGLRREMRGPGMDFGGLMNMMGPGMPQNTRPVVRDDESVSDIVSIAADSDTKEVRVSEGKKKGRGGRPKKKEVSI